MAKITPTLTAGGYNLAALNANIQALADELNNKVLYRTNPPGEPNQMSNDLDMNGMDILNVDRLNVHNLTVDGLPLTDASQAAVEAAQAAASASAVSAGQSAASAAQSAASLTSVQALFLGAFATDPASAPEGALYYNSTVLELRYRRSGVWVPFPQANTVGRQFFVGGTDFTAGTTTVLTLPATSYTKNVLWVYFDGAYVQPNRYTLTDQTHLTFTAPITAGTTRIEIGYVTPLASTIVDDNSLTTAKYQDVSVTTAKIADNAITSAKVSTSDIDNIKLKLDAIGRVTNISSLRTADITHYKYFFVEGYYGSADGGEGIYRITSDTTSADNGGTVITHTASGQRFYLFQRVEPTPFQFGARLDGTTNDAAAIQNMSNAQVPIRIPDGKVCVIGSNTTIGVKLSFGGVGARIAVNNSAVLTITGAKPVAEPKQLIFTVTGGGSIAYGGSVLWDDCPADWFDNNNWGLAITTAWKFSKVVTLNKPTYTFGQAAVVPAQRQGNVLIGKGYRANQLPIATGGNLGISYQRVAGQAASSLQVSNIEFVEAGLAKASTAILFRGAATGAEGSESVIYDDNWLRVENCVFLGLARAIDTKYTTQSYFTDNYYQANAICHFMARDSSFFYFRGEMALDNTFSLGSYIYQQDAFNDARSNGLNVTDCHSVLSAGIDIQLQHYQLAQFSQSSLDLGQGGSAGLYLDQCQDIHFHNGWIACTSAARTAGRVGVYYSNSRHSSFKDNTFNSCGVAFEGASGSSVSVNDNVFDNSLTFDITDLGSAIGWYVSGNKHKNGVTGAPISIGGGSSKSNIVVNNIMAGSSYAIPVGTNSISTPNVFSAGFPV